MADVVPNIVTSGMSFATLQKGGVSATLELVIGANGTATVDPTTAPTNAASGSGHTLPAANYWSQIVERNGIGMTRPSPASTSQTITLGQQLVVTPHALQTGNTAYDVYLSTVGSTGPFLLAATGQTASTTTFAAPLPANSEAITPTTINTTAFTYTDANGNVKDEVLRIVRSLKNGNFPAEYKRVAREVGTFLQGDAIPFRGALENIAHVRAALAIFTQDLTDIATLIDANPGTIRPTTDGIGNAKMVRTWP